jgi:hypothetical protein
LPDAGLSLCRAGLEEVAITLSLFPNDCALTDSASVSTIDYYLAGRMMRNGRGAKRKKEEAWASEQPATKLTCLHTAIGSGTDDVLGASYLMPECPETVICLPVLVFVLHLSSPHLPCSSVRSRSNPAVLRNPACKKKWFALLRLHETPLLHNTDSLAQGLPRGPSDRGPGRAVVGV